MTTTEKRQALENALVHFNFNKKFKVITDQIKGKSFAIAEEKTEISTLGTNYVHQQPITPFMTYEECNHYLRGCYDTQQNKFNFF